MAFPKLVSKDTNLFSYCDFIEYCCFRDNEMPFSDFDINDSSFSLADVLKELKRRLDLYSTFIPYRIKRRTILSLLKKKSKYLPYYYCLYFSLTGGTSQKKITNIFEKISDVSLKNYFNTDKSITTSIGQTNILLNKAIKAIRLDLKESKGSDEHIPKKAKDGGIDIITYKPADDRGNQLICLTDATIGRNWRTEKLVRNQITSWSQFIHFKACPLTCLSIVHVIEPEVFHSASLNNGLLFDRTRIMKYYSDDTSLTHALMAWQSALS
jgi:hypothetical protein